MIDYGSLKSVSETLDQMDEKLGALMKGFDQEMEEEEFQKLMNKCNSLTHEMMDLYKLEKALKEREAQIFQK